MSNTTAAATSVSRDSGAPRISVIVPTYNEAANLPHVFAAMPEVHEVVVVDGRSTDGTVEVARALRPDVTIVLQNRRGKGNAMACGFAAATGDVLVMLDADGSADPREIPAFVAALTAGADFAKGTRFAAGGGSNDITALRRAGNAGLNLAANLLFGTRYTDLCYGYNAFWADCLPVLDLDPSGARVDEKNWGDGFEIETIINTRIAKAGLVITEVPSFEFERIHGESNLNTFRDGFRVLAALLVERVRRTRRAPLVPRQATAADRVVDLTDAATAARAGTLTAGTLTAGTLSADTLTADTLTADTVTTAV
ncbi:glycosyltransferase [Kineococcus sp. R8]|uniref:glycosyltransferase family 2 protein n=1 Tax=Kineococcus siccus TaxID=2696567 RepID=UPI00141340AC|nr:glycosyltransferase family 2 protein [Kineococcus siccus]NAZ81071.1 glycosyltransferase [Kineococcus siccus]